MRNLYRTRGITFGLGTLVVLVLLGLGVRIVQAESLTFRILVSTGDKIDGKTLRNFNFAPALNDNGEVAFGASFSDDGAGIFTTSRGLLAATGDTIDGRTLISVNPSSSPNWLNNRGGVVFNVRSEGDSGIFTENALVVETGDTIDGVTVNGPMEGLVIDNDDIAFLASGGIFSTSRGFVVGPGDRIGGGETLDQVIGGFSVNSIGDVAFLGRGPAVGEGIFTPSELVAAPGDTIDGKTLTFLGNTPALNDNGEVVFGARFSGGDGIFTTSRGLVAATGDTIDERTLESVTIDCPALNDNGEIAFKASFIGGIGIFTTTSGFVVVSGDTIDGKTLRFFNGKVSLNNRGDIAFRVTFDDDSESIILAEKDTSPPSPMQPTCNGVAATLVGTRNDDILNGTAGDDVIVGRGGNDTINGRGGNDLICGGAGNDTLTGGAGDDELLGGKGDDVFKGGADHDLLRGGSGNDDLRGGGDNDDLRGQAGNDILRGNAGNDRLRGGDGDDELRGGAGVNDMCRGGPGSGDTARGCETVASVP